MIHVEHNYELNELNLISDAVSMVIRYLCIHQFKKEERNIFIIVFSICYKLFITTLLYAQNIVQFHLMFTNVFLF